MTRHEFDSIKSRWLNDQQLDFVDLENLIKAMDKLMTEDDVKRKLEKFAQMAEDLAKEAEDASRYNPEEFTGFQYGKLSGMSLAYRKMAYILRNFKE